MTDGQTNRDRLDNAVRDARAREDELERNPEPSLGSRFAQIGILGWMIVVPVLLALLAGSRLDRWLGTGITLSAALTMAGAALGLWLAFRWMHEQ